MSRVIIRVTTVITHIRGLITPLITTHEPPGSGKLYITGCLLGGFWVSGFRDF